MEQLSYFDGIAAELEGKVEPGPCLLRVLKGRQLQLELVDVEQTLVAFALQSNTHALPCS